jgi:hypothetical protein
VSGFFLKRLLLVVKSSGFKAYKVQGSGFRVKQRTAEQQNIEPQNFEGLNRCTLSFLIKLLKFLTSTLDIHYSLISKVCFPIKPAGSVTGGGAKH